MIGEHPQVTGVDSFEAVTTEGAGLRSCAPATRTKHGSVIATISLYHSAVTI
jgi:hypothetical protein